MKLPKTLGACADAIYLLRARRIAAEEKVKVMKKKEQELRNHIINTLPKSQATGVAGNIARVTISKKDIAKVVNWDDFYEYIAATNGFDLLERRVANGPARTRWENNEDIPGVEKYVDVSVNITKLGGT